MPGAAPIRRRRSRRTRTLRVSLMLLLPTSALAASTTRFNQGATGFFARDRTVGNVSAIDHDCTNDCSCAVGGGGLAGRLLLPRVALRRR